MAAVSSLIFRSVSRNFPLIRNSCANISTTTTYFEEHGNTTEKLNLKVFPTENTNEITNFSTIAEKLTGQVKSRTKGYGFITRKDTNEDILVPFNGVKKLEKSGNISVNLKPGDDVEFDVISQDGKEIAWNVTKIRKRDKLYEQIDVEIKAHQPDVLKSYSFFATQAASALDINILESWPEPEPHKVRKTLLRSAFVVKKSRVQYEFRTYYHMMKFGHLTESTAITFLEYIQRNLPEGVAMKVTKYERKKFPDLVHDHIIETTSCSTDDM